MAHVTDQELLKRYATAGSEEAFAEIVARHTNMAYSVCRRMLDAEAAEDAVQATFLVLARKARGISADATLAGWIHRAARHAAQETRRAQARRQEHERKAAEMRRDPEEAAEEKWAEVRPLLDAAIDALPAAQRNAVVLRYMSGKTEKEVAAEMGWTRSRASMTLQRALEQVRHALRRRGVAVAPTALAGFLATRTAEAAPAGMAGTAAAVGLGKAACSGTVSAVGDAVAKSLALVKIKAAALWAAAAGAGAAAVTTATVVVSNISWAPAAPVSERAAVTWYAAADGKAENAGTEVSPWDLGTSLANTKASILPGDTVMIRGGTYRAAGKEGFESRLTGTAERAIAVRAAPGERAVIDAKGTACGLTVRGAWSWFQGLEVMDSSAERRGMNGNAQTAVGVTVKARGVKCIHMVIHDTAQAFSAYEEATDAEFYGNLVYYNGFMGAGNQGRGAFNIQNMTGLKTVENNFAGDNADTGVQVFASGSAHVQGIRITGNTIYNNGSWPGGQYQYNIHIAGGPVRKDIQVRNNVSFFTPERDYGFNQIGHYSTGKDIAITDNAFIGGAVTLAVFQHGGPVVFSGNRLYNRQSAQTLVRLDLAPGQGLTSYLWDRNAYNGMEGHFYYDGFNRDFAGWKTATGFDANSAFDKDAPRGAWIDVRPDKHEPGRAHVTALNWDRSSHIDIDLGKAGLRRGDRYEVRDAQNFFGPPAASGVYDGNPAQVQMTGLAKAAPVGFAAPPHTAPLLGTFVVLKR
jgi:RNA polymerase sigma factor (sigma-70 family)